MLRHGSDGSSQAGRGDAGNRICYRHEPMVYRLFILASVLLLSSCSSVPTADYRPMPRMPDEVHPAPISLTALQYAVPTGAQVGSLGAGLCLVKQPVGRTDLRGAIVQKDIKEAFHDTLQAEGYDTGGGDSLIFPEEIENDEARTEYRVGAQIIEARADLCEASAAVLGLTPTPGIAGKLHLKIRWHVFDSLHQTTVYHTETEGFAERRLPNPEGAALLMTDAFAMAAHNLGADPDFQRLIVDGIRPPQGRNAVQEPERPRRFNPSETVALQNRPLSHTPFTDHAEASRRTAVLVQTADGHGSGFFIAPDGYILTNAHVVGGALHVRIVTADRQAALIAEVVRSDPARDVALLRLMAPLAEPAPVLPIRTDWPTVGTRVYLVGAPRDPRLQDSVTSGIVSAWRRHFAVIGTHQDFIQSDVNAQPGNSGGPLLDENGNIVGMTDIGTEIDGNATGLNYFIPIGEALDALRVTLQ
jgi:serine protease Do